MCSLPIEAQKVLKFWYGEGIKEGYKQKWFSDMGTTHQEEIDRDVTRLFGVTLKQAEKGELNDWAQTPRGLLALILVLDQFSRHIYRIDNQAQKKANDAVALQLAHEGLSKGWDKLLHVEELVFLCMPIRHSATIPELETLLTRIDTWGSVEEDRLDLVSKFRRTTLNRLQHMEGQSGNQFDILEFHAFEADESDIMKNKVTNAVRTFLDTHKNTKYDALLTSLSGGVDSMVLTKILHILSPLYGNFKVLAAHIDYGNRPESGAEADFVEEWCAKYNIIFRKKRIDEFKRGVTPRDEYEKESRKIRYDLYKTIMNEYSSLHIPAVMVGHHKGDVQENVISNMMKGCSLLDLAGMAEQFAEPAGTAHMKLTLSFMEQSIVNGVCIWRPLLVLPKLPYLQSDILEFAHKYGVPYFKDTTPKWSTRGKVRNQLLPLLKEIYGVGFPSHLSALAADSEQLQTITYDTLLQPFWSSVVITRAGVYFDCKPYSNQPALFWKEALTHVCHDILGVGLISDKPIKLLLEALKNPNQERPEFFPTTPYGHEGGIVIGKPTSIGPWTVNLSLSAPDTQDAGIPLTIYDVFSGSFGYTLPYADAYQMLGMGKKVRPKVLRQVNKILMNAIPFTMETGDGIVDINKRVQVHLLFNKKTKSPLPSN